MRKLGGGQRPAPSLTYAEKFVQAARQNVAHKCTLTKAECADLPATLTINRVEYSVNRKSIGGGEYRISLKALAAPVGWNVVEA